MARRTTMSVRVQDKPSIDALRQIYPLGCPAISVWFDKSTYVCNVTDFSFCYKSNRKD